ncbi:NAD(P)-dependent oxidoreductase [Iodidimonas gelatinilytica]|uniref:NAD(P)-dependent oxidoreductase n=1 Tax=Iodidimonas gelatinilytica TaxID=1236966 RepID=A0A5A7N092_9PROT|nr:SDR family oxidoreductase [Iodidimonas gelatinilytica]GER01741.1 NAD(P)-dependent oxidoreductase [Iodidimonas gelatinilytica]
MAEERLFCFGLGYSARFLARHLQAQGWQVAGTVRSEPDRAALEAAGIAAFLFDGQAPMDAAGRAMLADSSYILSSVPPDDEGDPVERYHRADLAALGDCRWVGYLSTSGVYGDHGGGWVDETTPPAPISRRAVRRLMAETAWRSLGDRAGLPVHIFRLAGIYGPGRSPIDAVRAGQARRIAKPGQVFSRIHVADIARALMASMARPRKGGIYNLCDDCPASSSEVIAYAASLLGQDPPPEVPLDEADLSPMARSFYSENKRVRNRLMHVELGVELAFPDYKAGLASLLDKP